MSRSISAGRTEHSAPSTLDRLAGVSLSRGWSRSEVATATLFGAAITAFLLCTQAIIQNVHISTTNGLWKSLDVARWIQTPSWALIEPSNAIFYPVYAALARVLNALGVFPGMAWRQMAIINALFAGISGAIVFAFVSRWTRNLTITLLASTAYMLSGFVLLHGLVNEDIMPGFTWILASTLMACAWFGKPTALKIIAVALVFAIGWLFEWRLMFPSLPPLLLALFLAPGSALQRVWRPSLFLAAMAVPPAVVAASTLTVFNKAQALKLFFTLFWTGKGVGTGWGGYSANKLWFEWSGTAEAIFGARHLQHVDWLWTPSARGVLAGTFLMIVFAVLCVRYIWRNRENASVRAAAVIVGGNAVCGVIFNLYSQPQDPQMQINVMIWALFGWVLLMKAILGNGEQSRSPQVNALALVAAATVAVIPSAYALKTAYEHQGTDRRAIQLVNELDKQFDPKTTVYVYHDFDPVITWQSTKLGLRPHTSTQSLPPAPTPIYKWIGIATDSVLHPEWSGAQHAEKVIDEINRALALGYRVVTSQFWTTDEAQWISSYSTIVPNPEKTRDLRRVLHETFQAKAVWTDPDTRVWSELVKKP